MDDNKKLDIEILNFLNVVAKDTKNGYVWREACGFIKEFERVKNLTIPFVVEQREQLDCNNNELDCPYDFTSRCTMGRCNCKPKAN